MIAIGIAIGLGGSLMMGLVLGRFLFGVSPNDPWPPMAVCVALGAVACFLPALRANRVSPLVALRSK